MPTWTYFNQSPEQGYRDRAQQSLIVQMSPNDAGAIHTQTHTAGTPRPKQAEPLIVGKSLLRGDMGILHVVIPINGSDFRPRPHHQLVMAKVWAVVSLTTPGP